MGIQRTQLVKVPFCFVVPTLFYKDKIMVTRQQNIDQATAQISKTKNKLTAFDCHR